TYQERNMHDPGSSSNAASIPRRRWSAISIAALAAAWLVLQIGGLFTPGLLDDVDSVYIQIAREMLQRHDFVTPTIDGIRFFDKPPLMYWMAAGSMRLFGIHDWAARPPRAPRPTPPGRAGPRRPLRRPRHGHLHWPLHLHPLLHPRHPHRPLDDP